MAGSVLADSAMEHYRGSFDNRAMLLPIASSALAIAADSRLASGRVTGASPLTASIHAASIAVGAAGLGFHTYNVTRKAGGISWNNLFYRAPIGAPAALVTSGMLGVAAQALGSGASYLGPLPLLSGRALAGFTALGLAGASAEAALLHFRGAYHDSFMWLPVTLPPLSAAALARAAMTGRAGWITTATLAATAAVGLFGMAFHAYGVSRNMGGWKNWRQNILAGPPLPAPPSFTGLAIAGLGALMLIRRFARG
ncbi:hypothetical protein [Croceibacterium aestuarii]|uniref:hypothetical protein n=1 Tax=Croceibacterium aestuarii TaxID=3064139 RepID=UPI00272DFC2F|nr:hypothetical protein [Croceibacterium sp. D39]